MTPGNRLPSSRFGIALALCKPYRKYPIDVSRLTCSISGSSIAMSSSLEDRVRNLCEQAASAKTTADLDVILPQLRTAIRDHISYFRAHAVEAIEAFGHDSNNAAD